MLSPRDDDDDDSHLCIKCSATIIGLDNYVKHRKEKCGKHKTDVSKVQMPLEPLESSYDLGADMFFQSLELQSSVKKSLSRLTPPIPISKASMDRKTSTVVASTSRELPRMSPIEHNLRAQEWIGGHSLRIGTNEDNQTKLINAVARISGAAKKEILSFNYDPGFKGDDESEESDESEEDDEEESHASTSKWKPPLNYTGGKWRPASPEHEDWDETGGKWRSLMADANERDEDYDAPPPDHTKGKWVPGSGTNEKTQIMRTTIQSKGSVQYWCGPCNRRLGSRAIYEKHLMSNLHMRKVQPEHELEFSGHLGPPRNVREKRAVRPSRFVSDDAFSLTQRKKRTAKKSKTNTDPTNTEKKKRRRRPQYVNCPGCKSRVRLHVMGKHLISHYHFRKAITAKNELYDKLILDNIDAIVHQSPFQCSPCKFYTNWLPNFMQHWLSGEHEQRISLIEGKCWCSFCKFECDTNQEMLDHLTGSDHTEVIAVINRSMPIIIRKKTIFQCDTCNQKFRYNVEVKQHFKRTGHPLPHMATDDYQELHNCQHCKAKFKSSLTLAAHLKSKHKQKLFFCLVCGLTFITSIEAKHHRQTSQHRIKKKIKLQEQGVVIGDLSKKCPYCIERVVLKNILELKEHIRNIHPDIRKSCPKCGMTFILSQEVTRHVRDNACQFQSLDLNNSSLVWNCSQCLFTTHSQAECFFHEVLHSAPVKEVHSVGDKQKVVIKYTCPLCPKSFRKASLRHHLKLHTFERPFDCSICGANFTRQSSLSNHVKLDHGANMSVKMSQLPQISDEEDAILEQWRCGKCGKNFHNKSAIVRHGCPRPAGAARRCPHDQCGFVAASAAQLSKHRRVHGERIKHHECSLCSFKTDQASHLKRHMMCHEGSKPYACPHCVFICGSLENLRKHVLKSGRHPGAALYECRMCPYSTNLAMQLRGHLVGVHADKYDARSAMRTVAAYLKRDPES